MVCVFLLLVVRARVCKCKRASTHRRSHVLAATQEAAAASKQHLHKKLASVYVCVLPRISLEQGLLCHLCLFFFPPVFNPFPAFHLNVP